VKIEALLGRAYPLLPLLQVDKLSQAIPLAVALHEGGLSVLEVALRTPQALAALTAIRKALPQLCVGVGSVTSPAQFQQALDAGAQFAVSPGFTSQLAEAAADSGLPWLPAAMTPSEILHVQQAGFRCVKLFPAAANGTPLRFLHSLLALFPELQFCPTGGITAVDLPDLLKRPNVLCVGGSLLCPPELIRAGDFVQIRKLALEARALAS